MNCSLYLPCADIRNILFCVAPELCYDTQFELCNTHKLLCSSPLVSDTMYHHGVAPTQWYDIPFTKFGYPTLAWDAVFTAWLPHIGMRYISPCVAIKHWFEIQSVMRDSHILVRDSRSVTIGHWFEIQLVFRIEMRACGRVCTQTTQHNECCNYILYCNMNTLTYL